MSSGAVDRSRREERSTGPQPPPLQSASRGISRRHQSCSSEGGTTAGEFPKKLCGRSSDRRPTFRPGQPQTNKRKCGIQPAHQSLLTDVFRSRPLLCTIYPVPNFTPVAGRGIITSVVLDLGHQSFLVRCQPALSSNITAWAPRRTCLVASSRCCCIAIAGLDLHLYCDKAAGPGETRTVTPSRFHHSVGWTRCL